MLSTTLRTQYSLSNHAVDRARERFPALCEKPWEVTRRVLTSVVNTADPVDISYVQTDRVLRGTLVWDGAEHTIWFIAKPTDGLWVVVTCLTSAELEGNGSIR